MDLRPKNNDELRKLVRNGVLDCEGKNLTCNFDINIEADIVNCRDIKCLSIKCYGDIKCRNINCWNIICVDINCKDVICLDISCRNTNCRDITCSNIICRNITCRNISYYAVCIAYQNITCNKIQARRKKHIQKTIDGKITTKKKQKKK